MTQQQPEQEASEPLQPPQAQQQQQFGGDEKRNGEGAETREGLGRSASSRRRAGSDPSSVIFAISDVDLVVESPRVIPEAPEPAPRPWDSRLSQDSALLAPDSGGGDVGDVGFEFRSAWSLPEITADQIFFNGRIKPLYLGSGISHPGQGGEFVRPHWIGKGPDPRPPTTPPEVEGCGAPATPPPPLPPKRMTPVAAGTPSTTAPTRRQRVLTLSMPSMRTLIEPTSNTDVDNVRSTATTDTPSASVAASTATTSPKTRRLSGQDKGEEEAPPNGGGFCLWTPGACGSGGGGPRRLVSLSGGRRIWSTWELLASRAGKLKKKAAEGSPTAGPEPGAWKPKHATEEDKKRGEWVYM